MGGAAWEVGVSLIMSGNTSQFMAGLSKSILGAHVHAHDLEKTLNRIGRIKLAIGGGIAIAGGITALKGMEKLVDRGNELVKVQQNMAAAGVSAADAQEAMGKAWQMTAKYQNIGATEVMKMINDARMTFGSQHDATHHIDDFVKMASFLRSFEGGKHGSNASGFLGEVNAAMKSGEIAGKITPEEMKTHVRQLTAMKVAYGEQLKIQQYLTAQRAAGASMRNASDEFRYGMFPALVQENGSNAGVMLMTAFNKIVAGTGNRAASLQHMYNIGLLNKELVNFKNGKVQSLKDPDGIKGSREAAMNFGDWVLRTLKPKVDAFAHGDHTRESQIIASMFPDRNAQKAVLEILQQFTKFSKDAKLMAEAYRSLNMEDYVDKSWEGQKQAFVTQWDNFLEALGSPLVGPATDMLRRLNTSLVGMGQWASRPEMAGTIEALGKGIAVLGVALTGGGAVAILAALGPAGWIAVGIVAATGAFIAFREPFENWVKSVTGLGAVLDGLDAKFNEAAKAFGDLIAKIIATLTGGLTGPNAIINGGKPSGELPDELPGLPIHKGSYTPGGAGIPDYGTGRGSGPISARDMRDVNPEMAEFIRKTAIANGIDPNVALRIANSEGLRGSIPGVRNTPGDKGTSFGPFQLHYASRIPGLTLGGLGDRYTRETGHHASDPRYWKEQIEFALRIARKEGWGAWHGRIGAGIGTREGIGVKPKPTVTPPPKTKELVAHLQVNLDGRKVAMNTSRHQFNEANGPATAANFSDATEMYPQVA